MKWRVMASLLSGVTLIAFAGAISGTLAWYAYATRASVSYGGTSVYSTAQLQIGLKTDSKTFLVDQTVLDEEYTLDEKEDGVKVYTLNNLGTLTYSEVIAMEDKTYWFAQPGTGFSETDIQNYLSKTEPNHMKSGDATVLLPCTTREYKSGDDFKLYQNPTKLEYDRGYATGDSYSKIDFAFRVITTKGETVKNQNIWLMDAKQSVSGSASSALRLYFEGNRASENGREDVDVLFNPSEKKDGSTAVAGLLDLDMDGYYDYTVTDYASGTGKEYFYGLKNPYGASEITEEYVPSKETEDLNQTGADEYNTFYAKHKVGNTGYLSYDGIDLPKAEYLGSNTIYPDDKSGKLTGGTVLSSTADDAYSIADLSMTIYLEGWDHSVIDKNIDYQFQLGLTFQINKVE